MPCSCSVSPPGGDVTVRPLPTRLLPDSAEVIDGVFIIGGCNT